VYSLRLCACLVKKGRGVGNWSAKKRERSSQHVKGKGKGVDGKKKGREIELTFFFSNLHKGGKEKKKQKKKRGEKRKGK